MAECKNTGELASAAGNSKTDDKQFTCGICIGRYSNPRYLPTCGHTYCEHCLFKYTRNVQQGGQGQGQGSKYECPVCRKPNNLPEHDVTLQWVQTFPLNTVIIKMMESLTQSSKEMKEEQRICDPCKEEGETNAGLKFCLDCKEVLCKSGTKCHKKFKISKDHKLIDVTHISTETGGSDFFSSVGKCAGHPERDVEFYCKSHDVVICSRCSMFQHTACEVIEIEGQSIDDTKLQKDSQLLVTRLKTSIEHLNLLQTLRVETKINLKEKLKEIKENIEQVKDQVVQLIDNIVSHVSNITKQIEIEKEDEIDAEMVRVAKIKEVTEQKVALLDTIGKHGSERHRFVSAHLVKKQYEETDKHISEEDRRLKQLDAELIIADNLKKLMESTDVDKLVQIKVTESESNHTPLASMLTPPRAIGAVSNALRHSKLVKVEEHTVPNDTGSNPSYRGVSIYRDGRVILSDYTEKGYLHLYNPTNRTVLELMLDGSFSGVQIDDTRLAVSSGVDKIISIVIVDNKLRVEKTFKTQNKPFTIAALNNGQLAVAWSPPAFSVIDVSGTEIVQKLYLDHDTSGRKFNIFHYLAVDEMRQHVIQPSSDDKAMYCFDYTGKPIFMYTHPGLTNPEGVALDNCGNVYVCENSSSGSIHRVSPTGDPISVITEDVPSFPQAICCDVTGTGFWVTQNKDVSPNNNNEVLHFRLKQITDA